MKNPLINLIGGSFSFVTKFATSNSTLWALVITVILKVADLYLSIYKEDKEMKKRYVEFVSAMSKRGLVSVSLKESAEQQYKALLEEDKKTNG